MLQFQIIFIKQHGLFDKFTVLCVSGFCKLLMKNECICGRNDKMIGKTLIGNGRWVGWVMVVVGVVLVIMVVLVVVKVFVVMCNEGLVMAERAVVLVVVFWFVIFEQ